MIIKYLLDPEGPPSTCDGCGEVLEPGTDGVLRLAPGVELHPDVTLTNDNSWVYCSRACASANMTKPYIDIFNAYRVLGGREVEKTNGL